MKEDTHPRNKKEARIGVKVNGGLGNESLEALIREE